MPNAKLETYKSKATGVVFDYTDPNAQASLTAILDGTDIDSFGDVETALSTKYDINDESQISILDYDYVPYYADAESATRKIYWTNIKNGLKSFFDDLYCAIGLVPSGASSSNKLATASDVNDVWQANAVLGAKNLALANRATTQEISATNFTVDNSDVNIVTVDGTTSAEAWFNYMDIILPAGSYIGNGCTGGSDTTYMLSFVIRNAANTADETTVKCFNGDVNLNIPSGGRHVRAFIVVRNGKTLDNQLFKLMIREATDPDPTYAPYAMTNKQLTEKKADFAGIFLPYSVKPVYTGDLNNLSAGCTYVGANATNSPMDWCTVYTVSVSEIDMPNATYGYQIAYGVGSTAIFYRTKNSGTWGTWKKLFYGTATRLSSSNDLDSILEAGLYDWTNSNPTHSPESKSYCGMQVISAGGTTKQVVYHGGQYIYIREYAGSPLTWSSWFKFTGTVVS